MDDLISRKVAIEEFEEMVTSVSVYGESAEARYATNARIRFIEKLNNIPSVPAVPLDKLCEMLSEKCYCTPYPNDPTSGECEQKTCKECWKSFLINWMEEQNA